MMFSDLITLKMDQKGLKIYEKSQKISLQMNDIKKSYIFLVKIVNGVLMYILRCTIFTPKQKNVCLLLEL